MPPTNKDKQIDSADLHARLAARKSSVRSFLEKRNFDGLTTKQCDKLTEIVLRYWAAFRLFRAFGKDKSKPPDRQPVQPLTEEDLRVDRKSGPAQRRVFSRKVRKAIDAVGDALAYATDGAKTRVFNRTLDAFAVPELRAAKEALTAIPLDWNNFLHPDEPGRFSIEDPHRDATDALVKFFTEDCHLVKSDAHSRTAEIFASFRWRRARTAEDSDSSIIRHETDAVRKRQARRARRR